MTEEIRRSVCQFCHLGCGINAKVKDGKIVSYEAEPFHPVSGGNFLCTKVARGEIIEWLYHPDQLKYPLKRAGKRGEGKWDRITWKQALDEIAEKLEDLRKKHGPESVAVSLGTGRTYGDFLRKRWANLFGTPNTAGAGIICKIISYFVDECIVGWDTGVWPVLPGVTKCFILWGTHVSHSGPAAWRVFKQMKEAGTKVITIDPRFTEEVGIADLWLKIRPGTDAALAMGMANVIINEGLTDKEYIEKNCHGYEQFAKRAQEYPPDKVSEITWIEKDRIIQAARWYATLKPASLLWGVSTDQIGHNQVSLLHAKKCLMGITGQLDIPGGNTFTGPVEKIRIPGSMELNDMLSSEQRKKKLGADRFKLTSWDCYDIIEPKLREHWEHPEGVVETRWLMDAIWPLVVDTILTEKPYPIKALLCQSNNPIICFSGSRKSAEALRSDNLELSVVNDFWMTPTAALADYVLPAASHIEDDFAEISFFSMLDVAMFNEKAHEPLGERKPDLYLWRELGIRLGQEKYWPFKTTPEMWDHVLEPIGITWKDMMKRERHHIFSSPRFRKYDEIDPKTGKTRGWATLTGKIELYSTVFEKLGMDPLPGHIEPGESPYSTPELAKEYPIILTTGGRVAFALGIADGDWVHIETRTGKCRMKAHFNAGIIESVVHAEHNWWYPESDMTWPYLGGAFDCNINAVIPTDPDYFDERSGAFPLRAVQCKVYKAKESFQGQSQTP